MTDVADSDFFVVGGTVPPDALSYVVRATDDELLVALQRACTPTFSTPRQMGKSSLCVRTVRRLREQGARTLFLDLTKFGARNLTPEQWYAALLSEPGRELGLRGEMLRHWKEHGHFGPMQLFFGALTEVALTAEGSSIVAFIDEVDVTRSLAFSANEFFAGIRQCYVARATEPELARLTVCLLGRRRPRRRTPSKRRWEFAVRRPCGASSTGRTVTLTLRSGSAGRSCRGERPPLARSTACARGRSGISLQSFSKRTTPP